jgi:hypothetical protein
MMIAKVPGKRSGMMALLVLCAACMFVSGCTSDQEASEKKILAHDPAFRSVLDTRDAMMKELDVRQAEFQRAVLGIDNQIAGLKDKKRQITGTHAVQTDKIKKRLDPEKRRMEKSLTDMRQVVERMNVEIRDLDGDIKEIQALIDKKDKLSLTQEEMGTWSDRMVSLIERKAETAKKRDRVKLEIEITELKINAIK